MELRTLLSDSPEYEERRKRRFSPPTFTLKELKDAVPKEAFGRNTFKGVYYIIRHLTIAGIFFWLASHIDTVTALLNSKEYPALSKLSYWGLWMTYWFFQSLSGGAFWTLGHEAGHGTLSPYPWVNNLLGFGIHTIIMVPYYSWRWTHRMHHKGTASLEKDENYVPRTRSDFKLPPAEKATKIDYHELFGDVPLYTLTRLIFMTLLGFQVYMMTNVLGNTKYPSGTNHINPFSPLFKREHWHHILLSDVAICFVIGVLTKLGQVHGFNAVFKYYLIPYLLANHWVVILTYIQHTDPTLPHYRKGQWSFVRGSLATVDRPLLGWLGRFFLHNISHDHTAHHLFTTVPFYNLPLITKAIKPILKEHYSYDSTYTYYALWRSLTQCCFVEDAGDVLFYKNGNGELLREVEMEIRVDSETNSASAID
ncbi:hypothetical protein M422DRAFT_33273 [Sphaerobolus stellatus SS14]|uniref:Fatty acid desaturase domain-containing protein n=1 Tax=Sphaerobolus stellatus (strain SS14) TaxID=990650 RepID=A0A0C9UUF7_SPHS4|nr:hypothetical protein M422DRAFT_33273 [Sphaerobolus stellatus SS14]